MKQLFLLKKARLGVLINLFFVALLQICDTYAAPVITYSDNTAVGPVSSDTITIDVSGVTGVGTYTYGFSANNVCNGGDSYPNSFIPGVPIIINTETNNGQYFCAKVVDEGSPATNYSSASTNVLNIDATLPVITLLGSTPITQEVLLPYVDAGATASDDRDGDITGNIIVGGDSVDGSLIGNFTITYDVSDTAGNNAVQVTRTVNIVDTTIPVITLLGSDPVDVNLGDSYVDAGATADDTYDGDITGSIVVGGDSVDTGTVGTYVITYDVDDSSGNSATQITRTVNVVNGAIPVITLVGASPVDVEYNGVYVDDGATASDTEDGDISGSIVVGGDTVDTNTLGTYVITYDVTDSDSNNAIQVTRTVNVVDTTPPVITLLGSSPLDVEYGSVYIDDGATALDNYDGDISGSIVVGGDSVDTNTLGTYVITYNITDTHSNAATQVTRTVNVVDTTPPAITLIGSDPVNVFITDPFADPGATAFDNYDGDISGSIVVGGDVVDTNTQGTYIITYNVTDTHGNVATQVTRTVIVSVGFAPVITLAGADPLDIEYGSTYIEPGATASDAEDGDITGSIVVGGDTVDTNTLGTYTVTYDVTDTDSNNAAQVTRTVNIIDTTAPIITLLGSSPMDVEYDSVYVDDGATADDNYDGDITGSIVVGGDTVDTNTLGTYVITYDVIDSHTNAAITVSRTVNVVDTTPPVITLIGSSSISLTVGDSFTDAGATANDNYDGDITGSIVVGGDTVDTSIVGTYVITYDITDSEGNPATQVTRTVHVNAVVAPSSSGGSGGPGAGAFGPNSGYKNPYTGPLYSSAFGDNGTTGGLIVSGGSQNGTNDNSNTGGNGGTGGNGLTQVTDDETIEASGVNDGNQIPLEGNGELPYFENYIIPLEDAGIISDGANYKSQDPMTREQFLELLFTAHGVNYDNAVDTAIDLGLTDVPNNFQADMLIQRVEAVKFAIGLRGENLAETNDGGFIDVTIPWEKKYVKRAKDLGIVDGVELPNGITVFQPHMNLSKGEAAKIVFLSAKLKP